MTIRDLHQRETTHGLPHLLDTTSIRCVIMPFCGVNIGFNCIRRFKCASKCKSSARSYCNNSGWCNFQNSAIAFHVYQVRARKSLYSLHLEKPFVPVARHAAPFQAHTFARENSGKYNRSSNFPGISERTRLANRHCLYAIH